MKRSLEEDPVWDAVATCAGTSDTGVILAGNPLKSDDYFIRDAVCPLELLRWDEFDFVGRYSRDNPEDRRLFLEDYEDYKNHRHLLGRDDKGRVACSKTCFARAHPSTPVHYPPWRMREIDVCLVRVENWNNKGRYCDSRRWVTVYVYLLIRKPELWPLCDLFRKWARRLVWPKYEPVTPPEEDRIKYHHALCLERVDDVASP